MPRKSAPNSSGSKWRKRKRDADRTPDSDSEPNSGDEAAAAAAAADSPAGAGEDPVLDLRETEVISGGGERVSDFPLAVWRHVNRPHSSVLALASAERSSGIGKSIATPVLENISQGQLQVLSAMVPDQVRAAEGEEKLYVCTPPPLMEGKGVPLWFAPGQVLIVPKHSDWFSPQQVHRLERQVVPHFFSGKSAGHMPEKYVMLRNKIVAKYMENPGRRLTSVDCQHLVSTNAELFDLSRMVRFLDNWGIINYLAAGSVHRELRMVASMLRENAVGGSGELQLHTAPLKSIDSLILFDRPKCSLRVEDVAQLSSSASSSTSTNLDTKLAELDARIRERLTESSCSYCSVLLPDLHYQSQKEAETILCSDCFHDAKYVTGHSSLDFSRVDARKETTDNDGDSWTDQETFLLLEGIEKYTDNWNEIAEHVGTKSKAQCIHHFIRLPVEDGLFENIDLLDGILLTRGLSHDSHSNGYASSPSPHSGNQLPFVNSANPVMSLVAFLTSAIGPRVAAACANAALCVLTKEDDQSCPDHIHAASANSNFLHCNDGNYEDQQPHPRRGDAPPLSLDRVKRAAVWGLSAAAMKSKLFADQEEREIQRLAATIINHQLKRLELKLKQFAEVETLLLKECEQVERVRQRLSSEKIRLVTAAGSPLQQAPGVGDTGPSQRPVVPSFTGSLPASAQLQFLQRQQMLSFGPRLPMQPPAAAPGVQNQMLRSASANNSNMS